MFASVLIAVDSWEYTTQLYDLAKRICAQAKTVDIIYVDSSLSEKPEIFHYTEDFASLVVETPQKQIIQDALCYFFVTARISARGVLVGGDTAMAIVNYAKQLSCDVIIMGYRNLPAITRFFDPSIMSTVLRKAPCPVLVDHLIKLDRY